MINLIIMLVIFQSVVTSTWMVGLMCGDGKAEKNAMGLRDGWQ